MEIHLDNITQVKHNNRDYHAMFYDEKKIWPPDVWFDEDDNYIEFDIAISGRNVSDVIDTTTPYVNFYNMFIDSVQIKRGSYGFSGEWYQHNNYEKTMGKINYTVDGGQKYNVKEDYIFGASGRYNIDIHTIRFYIGPEVYCIGGIFGSIALELQIIRIDFSHLKHLDNIMDMRYLMWGASFTSSTREGNREFPLYYYNEDNHYFYNPTNNLPESYNDQDGCLTWQDWYSQHEILPGHKEEIKSQFPEWASMDLWKFYPRFIRLRPLYSSNYIDQIINLLKTDIIIDGWDFKHIWSLTGFFHNTTSYTPGIMGRHILRNFTNTQHIKDLDNMFTYWVSNDLIISNIHFENVESCRYMFYYSRISSDINIDFIDGHNLNDMTGMFSRGVFSNITINIPNLSDHIVCLQSMFSWAYVAHVNFNTRILTNNISGMFNDCHGLKTVDLRNIIITEDCDITGFLAGCGELEEIYLDDFRATSLNWIGGQYVFHQQPGINVKVYVNRNRDNSNIIAAVNDINSVNDGDPHDYQWTIEYWN